MEKHEFTRKQAVNLLRALRQAEQQESGESKARARVAADKLEKCLIENSGEIVILTLE